MAAIHIRDFRQRYNLNRRDVFRLADKGLVRVIRWQHDHYVYLIVMDDHDLYHLLALKK